jgi:hypothetical protein
MSRRRNSNSEQPRTLDEIGGELSHVIRNRTSGMLHIGDLLFEAKQLVEHGEWLSWLKEYRIEKRSAQRYVKAAEWFQKRHGDAFNDLGRVAPAAIYELSSGRYADDVVEQIISAAQHRHIGIQDVKAIAKSGARAPIIKEIVAEQKAAAEAEAKETAQQLAEAQAAGYETVEDWKQAEYDRYVQQLQADALSTEPPRVYEDPWTKSTLDGPPDPAVPPTAEPVAASSEQFHVATFEKAVEMLKTAMTKPLATFATARASPDDLDQVASFLSAVGQRRKTAA